MEQAALLSGVLAHPADRRADGGTDRYRDKTSQQGEQGHGRLDAVDPPAQGVPADAEATHLHQDPELTVPLLKGHHYPSV
jgi:hypothetical protein